MKQTNFWLQLIQRLATENPKFFKYIQWGSVVVAAVTGIPELLEYFGVHLTGVLLDIENKTLALAALLSAFISRLPNKDVSTTFAGNTGPSADEGTDPTKPHGTPPDQTT